MRGIPSKVEVVVGGALPLSRLEILKELFKKAALRKPADMGKSVRIAAWALILSNHHLKANTLI